MKATQLSVICFVIAALAAPSGYADLATKKRLRELTEKATEWEGTLKGDNSCGTNLKIKLREDTLKLIPEGTSDQISLSLVECLHSACWDKDVKEEVKKSIKSITAGVTKDAKSSLTKKGNELVLLTSVTQANQCDVLREWLMKNL